MPGRNDIEPTKDKKKKGPATPRGTSSPRTSITTFLNRKTSEVQVQPPKKEGFSSLKSENGSYESPRFKRATSLFFRKKRLTNVSDLELPSPSINTENHNKLETPPSEDKKTVLVTDTEYRFPVGAPSAVSYLEAHLLEESVVDYQERNSFHFTDYSQASPRDVDENVAESSSSVSSRKNLPSCFNDFIKKDETARAGSSSEGLSKGKIAKTDALLKRKPKVTSYLNLLPCFTAPLQQEMDKIKSTRETLLQGIVDGILIPALKKNNAYDAQAVQDIHHLIQGVSYGIDLTPEEIVFLNTQHEIFSAEQNNTLPEDFIACQRKELTLGADNIFRGIKTIIENRKIDFDIIFKNQQFISLMRALIKENCRYIQTMHDMKDIKPTKMIKIGNEIYYHQNYAAYRQNTKSKIITKTYGKLDHSLADRYGHAFKMKLLTLLEDNSDDSHFSDHFDNVTRLDELYVHGSFLALMLKEGDKDAFELVLNQTQNPILSESKDVTKGSLTRAKSQGF